MRRLELLKYHDEVIKVIDYLIVRIMKLIEKCEDDVVKKALRHVLNKLEEEKRSIWFSSQCKTTFNGVRVGITDLDKIIVVNGKIKALIEYKFRREDFNKAVITNAFQFITLRNLSFRSGLPLFYIFEIEEYGEKWFRVVHVDRSLSYRVRRLGNGHSRDTYALIDLDNSVLMDELEFKSWLREVMVV
jgi:hypothetical protein